MNEHINDKKLKDFTPCQLYVILMDFFCHLKQ
jgi:hypothetical protein